MTLTTTLTEAYCLAADMTNQADDITDRLCDAEIALEERDPDTRRGEVAACIELLNELESNAIQLRIMLTRVSK